MPEKRRRERGSTLEPEQRDFIENKLREEGLSIKAAAVQYQIAEGTLRNALNGKSQDYNTLEAMIDTLQVPDGKQLRERHRRLFHIPRERNPFFTGRDDRMQALREALETSRFAAVTQALSGLGGIGKTSTAIEYAYRCLDKDDFHDFPRYKTIQFARADTVEVLKYGYARIASALQLRLTDPNNPEEAVKAVLQWMARPEEAPWLLILDNADDPTLLDEFLPKEPQRHYGHVLITSRSQHFAHRIRRVDIEQLPEAEGVAFLYKRTGRERIAGSNEEAIARALVSEMGGLPLALEQAAAYMTREQAMPFEDYLAGFRDQKMRSEQMMQAPETGFYRQFEKLTREYTETLTVLTTWQMSLAAIEQSHPAAVELLQLCAFLHPVGIPRELTIALLPDYFAPAEGDAVTQNALYNRLLNVLADYSLIRRDLNHATHSVHILVQTVLRDAMTPEEQKQVYRRILKAVADSFPSMDYIPGGRGELYYPHAERLRAYVEQIGMEDEVVGRLLNRIGFYQYLQGLLADAEPLLKRALTIQQKVLSEDHPDIAISLNSLGRLRWSQDRYHEAEQLFRQAIEIWKKKLPEGCPGIAECLSNLGELNCSRGYDAEAESFYQQALALRQQVLPEGDPLIAYSLNSLAGLYHGGRRFSEAEDLYLLALAMRRNASPQDPSAIANSLNNLAKLYQDQGNYEKAELLYKEAEVIWRSAYGDSNYVYAIGLHNLARLYWLQGRHAMAEPRFLKVIEIWQQRLPEGHHYIAVGFNSLARLYRSQGRFSDAETYFKKALALRQQGLPGYPSITESLNDLAEMYRNLERFAEAIPLCEQALGILEARKKTEHPDYQAVLANYQRCLAQVEKEVP